MPYKADLEFACRSETFSHALLILNESLKWCMNRRQIKDPLSSTCQVSSERRGLDLESEVPGSILTGGNILLVEISHIVK